MGVLATEDIRSNVVQHDSMFPTCNTSDFAIIRVLIAIIRVGTASDKRRTTGASG